MSSTMSTEPTIGEQVAALAAFLRRTLRFWRVTLSCLLIGGVAFGVFYYLRQPTFRSETVILYVERGGPDQNVESSDAQRGVSLRLKELLMSRPNLERIITRFNLYPEVRQRYGMVDAVEELKKHIDFRAPGGDTFSIAFDGKSATEAQAVTAELARQVLDGDAELRKNQAKVALEFLVGERKTRETELRAAEQQLAAFMAQHPRFALDTTPLANGAAIRASMGTATPAGAPTNTPVWAARPRSGAALTGSSTASAVSAAASASPASPGAPGAPGAGAGVSPADEARARAALAAARESLTEKLVRYTPAHPDVRAAEAEVQRATERLALVSSAGRGPAPNNAVPAEASPPASPPSAPVAATPPRSVSPSWPRLAPGPAPAPSSSTAARGLVELETDWLKLTRAVTEARQRYDQLEGQLFRADIQASSATGGHGVHVNVIDPAFLPQTPLPPGRLTLALIFLTGSLLVGAIAAMLFAAFDERIFTERELASVTDVLVHVPRHATRRAYVPS